MRCIDCGSSEVVIEHSGPDPDMYDCLACGAAWIPGRVPVPDAPITIDQIDINDLDSVLEFLEEGEL